tara:strand:+ start:1160 stop:1846 length:687 start_codon:yes stop_codon:yes gene_type:complete
MIIKGDGFNHFFTWNKSKLLEQLYLKRVRLESPEMDSCKQAAEILSKELIPNETVLDVGCGSGYFFHSIYKKFPKISYYGIDANKRFVDIGNRELKKFGVRNRLHHMKIEDFRGKFDHIVCLNFLSNLDNFHRYLERLLLASNKTLIMRESISIKSKYKFVKDNYLDTKHSLSVFVNTYSAKELSKFIKSYGFSFKLIEDNRTKNKMEKVIDHPHYWKFVFSKRKKHD